jgi:hypothetical protein
MRFKPFKLFNRYAPFKTSKALTALGLRASESQAYSIAQIPKNENRVREA